jgi:hypothetical protein
VENQAGEKQRRGTSVQREWLAWQSAPEASRFIRSGADDRTIAAPGDNYGFAAQLWVISLFHGRVKRVHVDMDDFAKSHLANHFILECQERLRRFSIDSEFPVVARSYPTILSSR